jgi:hypothetical protein
MESAFLQSRQRICRCPCKAAGTLLKLERKPISAIPHVAVLANGGRDSVDIAKEVLDTTSFRPGLSQHKGLSVYFQASRSGSSGHSHHLSPTVYRKLARSAVRTPVSSTILHSLWVKPTVATHRPAKFALSSGQL